MNMEMLMKHSMFGLRLCAAVIDADEAIDAWQVNPYPPNQKMLAGSCRIKKFRAGGQLEQSLKRLLCTGPQITQLQPNARD